MHKLRYRYRKWRNWSTYSNRSKMHNFLVLIGIVRDKNFENWLWKENHYLWR